MPNLALRGEPDLDIVSMRRELDGLKDATGAVVFVTGGGDQFAVSLGTFFAWGSYEWL